MTKEIKLSENHLDALREISNVGGGHSATALSQILDRRVDMSVPHVFFLPLEEAVNKIARGNDPTSSVATTVSKVGGDIDFTVAVLIDQTTANNLLRIMKTGHNKDIELDSLSSMDRSIIKEIGNILLLHYISNINTFLSLKTFPESPNFTIDMIQAVATSLLSKEALEASHVLVADVEIFTDTQKLNALVLLLPKSEALRHLMKALFGEDWETL